MCWRLLLIFVVSVTAFNSLAQPSVKELEHYLVNLTKTPYAPMPSTVLKDDRNEKQLVDLLSRYVISKEDVIRAKAYYILAQIGQKSRGNAIRIDVVRHLATSLNDKNPGLSSNNLQMLTRFHIEDFGSIARDSISGYIRPNVAYADRAMRLAGYLNLQNIRDKIRSILESRTSDQNKWSGTIALARMGDEVAIDFIKERLRATSLNDQFVDQILPGLVFTRQKAIFDHINGFLLSSQKTCSSPDPNSSEKIECAYKIMEIVASSIEGFPVDVDFQGNAIVNNYEQALADVRVWIANNPDYIIIKDAY